MIQPQSLKVADPLAKEAVTIVIKILPAFTGRPDSSLQAGDAASTRTPVSPHDRPVTIAIGLANEVPLLLSGRLTELDDLIAAGWQTFGRNFQEKGSSAATDDVSAQTLAIPDPSAAEQDPDQTKKSNLSLF